MRIKLQLVMCSDDGQEDTITDLVTLQKDSQRIEHLHLPLREANSSCTPSRNACCNTKLTRFSTRAQPARTAASPSRSKAPIAGRSVPCLGPSSSPVHDCFTAAARVAGQPRSDHC